MDKVSKTNQYLIVKLPCNHSQEIKPKRDQLIVCAQCFKQYAMTWSLQPKIILNDSKLPKCL